MQLSRGRAWKKVAKRKHRCIESHNEAASIRVSGDRRETRDGWSLITAVPSMIS